MTYQPIETMLGKLHSHGDVYVVDRETGELVTRIDANVYGLSVRYEHPEGITLTRDDAERIGLEIEGRAMSEFEITIRPEGQPAHLALPLCRNIEKQGTTVTIADANGETVALFEHQVKDGRNAAEIVRRVNLHDELVEALRDAANRIEEAGLGRGVYMYRAILAKVDQKEGR